MSIKHLLACCTLATFCGWSTTFAQNIEGYSAVNPVFFRYGVNDIHIRPLVKYNNGANIISPDPEHYPWEARLENGMPNVLVDENGNTAIYISSFVNYASNPPSKVGAMVFTNSSSSHDQWFRPDAGLYWYNAAGATSDDKISPVMRDGYLTTNIVAIDIESLGIFDEGEGQIKLLYLPQRESHNQVISSYLMPRTVDFRGVLTGFSSMKVDRATAQKNFTFPFINGDTHMNFLKVNGEYYFVSRLNSKRASLQEGETLPLRPDNRKRYRRETVTNVGENIESKNVSFDIALDMSNSKWEPYSMQPFRMPGFDNDIWWGLVTMFGTEGEEDIQFKQRTELAFTNDGESWHYLKPGVPFLDNGADPNSDDHGCINIAKPVWNTKFSTDPTDALYFYAASNQRHVDGRNPGISLATGKVGKIAGLQANSSEKTFSSIDDSFIAPADSLLRLSYYGAFYLGNTFFPAILADITADPRGKSLSQLGSYVAVLMYAYNPNSSTKKGDILGAGVGSSIEGTTQVSENYESAPFIYGGIDARSKHYLLVHLKNMSDSAPGEIIRMSSMAPIPVVMESKVKNAVFYGLGFDKAKNTPSVLLTDNANNYRPSLLWSKSISPSAYPFTEDFSNEKYTVNYSSPINRERGTIAVKAVPQAVQDREQYLFNIYGHDVNQSIELVYETSGSIRYTIIKDGHPFAEMKIDPPSGQSFSGKEISVTLESVPLEKRKHGANLTEDAAVLYVSCPELNFEAASQHPILWNWKHEEGSITDSDRANARAFAYLSFTAFVPELSTITIGAKNQAGAGLFAGSIEIVEFADSLPTGNDDFWN